MHSAEIPSWAPALRRARLPRARPAAGRAAVRPACAPHVARHVARHRPDRARAGAPGSRPFAHALPREIAGKVSYGRLLTGIIGVQGLVPPG